MGRQPHNGEELGWVGDLQAGQSEEQVLSQILGDSSRGEFYARTQTLMSSAPPDQRYLQALYQLLLGRTADSAELSVWLKALPGMGREGMALALLQSQECRADQFEGDYDALL